jgi:hypothetical protein
MSTFLLKKTFHTDLCQRLIDDIQYQRSNYYYFLGRIAKWNVSDTVPTTIVDSLVSETSTRSEMVSFKKVKPSDISFIVRRINWTTATVFDQYDSTIDLTSKDFYVITDEFNVYKCLDNASGIASTIKPTGVSLYPLRTADGYLWKYLYTVQPFKRSQFLSDTKMPVQRALTDRFYNNGSIDAVNVTSPGSGYEDTLETYIELTGGTTGAGGVITATVSAGVITNTTISNGGTGYTSGARITVTPVSVGAGAVLVPVISAGIITGVTIVNGGSGYTTGANLSVTVGGAIAIPAVSVVDGSITKVVIVDQGIGYATEPTLDIFGLGGSGIYGNPSAVLVPVVYDGKVVNIAVDDPGKDYPTGSSVTIDIVGDGSGAMFRPVIYDGGVVDVVIENPGIGYTYAMLTVTGANTTQATLSPVLSESDLTSDQSTVEQTSVPGAIYNIKAVNLGTNYPLTTTVTISGDGDGAFATPVIVNGQIVSYTMTAFGTGYSFANITISSDNLVLDPNSLVASAYAIISPLGGHGTDAVAELYSDSVCLYSNIRFSTQTEAIAQDFREYGLIKNIRDLYTNNLVTSDFGLVAYTATLNNITGLVKDEILISSGVSYRVVDIIPATSKAIIISITLNPLVSPTTLVAESDITRSYSVLNIDSTPSCNKYSGQMLFVSDSDAFTFSDEQEITIKTFMKL